MNTTQGDYIMTKQEKIQCIETVLETIHTNMYPHSPNNRTGYNCNWLVVLTSDLEEALELIEMNNLECEAKENPFRTGYTDITIHLEKKEEERPLWGYRTA
ncbi:MAG: hypothetical protein ACR2M6_00915 [Vampirovibrionia bacterium]